MEMHVPAAILEARHTPVSRQLDDRIEFESSPQLLADLDRDTLLRIIGCLVNDATM